MAARKYLDPKSQDPNLCKTKVEALQKMIDIDLKPCFIPKLHNSWRKEFYWTEENDALYKIYFKMLHWIYMDQFTSTDYNQAKKQYMSKA